MMNYNHQDCGNCKKRFTHRCDNWKTEKKYLSDSSWCNGWKANKKILKGKRHEGVKTVN
jgi:hypothetical protein